VEAYKNALKTVKLYGPTNFAPIVELVNDMASEEKVTQDNQKYFILLIITDGIISDLQATIDQVVRGSSLPLSIIIVGVGNADFSKMDVLDADDVPLYSKKYCKYMDSDIVQFVPFRQFKNNPTQLAKETLEEVPRQLLDFMKKNNITPNPASEHKRRQIQQKLSMQKAQAGGDDNEEDFFSRRKEDFIKTLNLPTATDEYKVKDFLDTKGLHEENRNLLFTQMRNPSY
jgi:hypothetical protein